MTHSSRNGPRLPRWIGHGLLCVALTACGGGVYVGLNYGNGVWRGADPPAVALTASAGSAAAGTTIELAAAATDDTGIQDVTFYKVDPGGSTQVGLVKASPYKVAVVVPATATTSVTYFARARDDDDNTTDSARITVTVLPN